MDAVVSTHWMDGGKGAIKLAEAVIRAAEVPSHFKQLYQLELSIKEKIETIAREIYGADGVDYSEEAEKKIALYTQLGFGGLPICMAKTHLSFTPDASIKGAPTGFRVPVRDIRASVGAGFIYPLLGEMRTCPFAHPPFSMTWLDLETGNCRVVLTYRSKQLPVQQPQWLEVLCFDGLPFIGLKIQADMPVGGHPASSLIWVSIDRSLRGHPDISA
jgi:hypothetical protein